MRPLTTYSYNDAGYVATIVDQQGTTSFEYDDFGRESAVILPVALTGEAGGPETDFTYDGDDNTLSVRDGNGNLTKFAYDIYDNLETVCQPEVNVGGLMTHPVTTYTHNDLGDTLSVEDADLAVTTYKYDVLDQQIQVVSPDQDSTDDIEPPVTSFAFDALGDVIEQTAPQPDQAAPIDTTTHDAYDGFARLATVTDANSGVTAFGYDADGNTISETDADGNTTGYTVNFLGETTVVTDPLGNVTTDSYNLAGELTGTVNRDGQEIDYAYDNLGRETSEIWAGATFRNRHDIQRSRNRRVGQRSEHYLQLHGRSFG